jgi:hypothetical protein
MVIRALSAALPLNHPLPEPAAAASRRGRPNEPPHDQAQLRDLHRRRMDRPGYGGRRTCCVMFVNVGTNDRRAAVTPAMARRFISRR